MAVVRLVLCGAAMVVVVVAGRLDLRISLAGSRDSHCAVYRDDCMHLVKVKRGVRGYSRPAADVAEMATELSSCITVSGDYLRSCTMTFSNSKQLRVATSYISIIAHIDHNLHRS